MDLVTLVTACALSADPRLMHALVWHQSGGEPWALSVPGEALPRVYPNMRDAISEAHTLSANGNVRVGLAGLSSEPARVNAAMFLPCRNVALAARQIERLASRCKAEARFKDNSTYCAIAAYRGSWSVPDSEFADAVIASVANSDAPNFDMPKDTGMEFLDIASDAPARPEAVLPEPAKPLDDHERGWSSALFPAKELRSVAPPNSMLGDDHRAKEVQSGRTPDATAMASKPPFGGLFVATSRERRPQ